MEGILLIFAALLLFGMVGCKGIDERKSYTAAFVVCTILAVICHMA